jgi:transcription initiation factor TFIID subunit TAF12
MVACEYLQAALLCLQRRRVAASAGMTSQAVSAMPHTAPHGCTAGPTPLCTQRRPCRALAQEQQQQQQQSQQQQPAAPAAGAASQEGELPPSLKKIVASFQMVGMMLQQQ